MTDAQKLTEAAEGRLPARICSAILDYLELETEAVWRAEDARIQQVLPELRLDVAAHSQYLRGIADGIRRAELALRDHLPDV